MSTGVGITVLALIAWGVMYAAAAIEAKRAVSFVVKAVLGVLAVLAAIGAGGLAASTGVGGATGWVIDLAEGIRIALLVLLIIGCATAALVIGGVKLGKGVPLIVAAVVASWVLTLPALTHGLIPGSTGASITDGAGGLARWVGAVIRGIGGAA